MALMHIVYRLFDADERLLYVGRTGSDLHTRLLEHRARPWWAEVGFCYLEFVADREMAKQTESAAIKYEKPQYNIKGADSEAEARKRIKRHSPPPKPGTVVSF